MRQKELITLMQKTSRTCNDHKNGFTRLMKHLREGPEWASAGRVFHREESRKLNACTSAEVGFRERNMKSTSSGVSSVVSVDVDGVGRDKELHCTIHA